MVVPLGRLKEVMPDQAVVVVTAETEEQGVQMVEELEERVVEEQEIKAKGLTVVGAVMVLLDPAVEVVVEMALILIQKVVTGLEGLLLTATPLEVIPVGDVQIFFKLNGGLADKDQVMEQ